MMHMTKRKTVTGGELLNLKWLKKQGLEEISREEVTRAGQRKEGKMRGLSAGEKCNMRREVEVGTGKERRRGSGGADMQDKL